MTIYKALRIPYDRTKPVEEVDYNEDDDRSLAKLVFEKTGVDPNKGTIDMASFRQCRTQMAYDDLGMYTQPEHINTRAMALWAVMTGMRLEDFRQPLWGDFIVLGVTPEAGETEDVDDRVRALFAELKVSE